MNVLPLIISVISIFSMLTMYQMKGLTLMNLEKNVYMSHMQSARDLHNKQERLIHRRSARNQKSPTNKRSRSFTRKTEPGHKLGSFNLHSLIALPRNERKKSQLYKITIRYLSYCYRNGPLLNKSSEFSEQLLDSILDNCEGSDEYVPLYKINLPDQELMCALYKMNHGTITHEIQHGIGYPPLHSIISTSATNKPPIRFKYATGPALTFIFGESCASEIIKMEQVKGSPLSKQELEVLAKKHMVTHRDSILNLIEHN